MGLCQQSATPQRDIAPAITTMSGNSSEHTVVDYADVIWGQV